MPDLSMHKAADILGRFTDRFWQKFPTDGLLHVRSRIESVIDFRARQFGLFEPAELPPPVLIEFPAPASVPDEPITTCTIEDAPAKNVELGAVLSPSQVSTFLDCQPRWWYKHGLKIEEPRNANLALGTAIHAAIGENYKQKIETKQDLPLAGVLAVYRAAWTEQEETARFHEDEDRADIGATGEVLVAKYLEEASPFVEPAAVELELKGEIAGVKVQGKLDVLDIDGRIIDVKSAAKSPSGIRQSYRRQVATYVQIEPRASGEVRLDTLTKTKTVKMIQQSFTVDASDRAHARAIFPLVQEAMREGLYVPNRESFLCSRRNCPYWERCEADYGGKVDEK